MYEIRNILINLQMVYHHVKPELDDDVTNIISLYL